MITTLISLVAPVGVYSTVSSQVHQIIESKKFEKKSKAHIKKCQNAVDSVLDDKEVFEAPALDADVDKMIFGIQPDLGMSMLLSNTENFSFTRFLRSLTGRYKYTDEILEEDDKSILKYAYLNQASRSREYMEMWLDKDMLPPDITIEWYLTILEQERKKKEEK